MKIRQITSLLLAFSMVFICSGVSAFAASGITASGVDKGDGTGEIILADTSNRGTGIYYVLSKDGVIQTPDPQTYSGAIRLPSYGTWSVAYAYADKPVSEASGVFKQPVVTDDPFFSLGRSDDGFAAAPDVSHSYDWKTDQVTLTGAQGTSYGITNKAALTTAEIKTMQAGSTNYSSAFTLNSSAAMMYVYVWPTKLEEDTNNYTKISINTQPAIPRVSYSYNPASKSITLTDDAATDGPLYYVISTTDPGTGMPDNATSLLYGLPIDAISGNWNYVTIWHSMIPAFKDRGVTLKIQTNAPKPSVTIEVNDASKEIKIIEPVASGLPLYYWYDDGTSGLSSAADQQAASTEYKGSFKINEAITDCEIKVWHSQDTTYSGNFTVLSYYRDQSPPTSRISFDLTSDSSNYKLSISGGATLPYKLFYTVKEGGNSVSEVRDYTAALTLLRDRTYTIEAFYSNDGGVLRTDNTTFTIAIDADGNFNTLDPDKNLQIIARGNYLYFAGPSSTCEYSVRVFNPDTATSYSTFTKSGPFTEEEIKLPEGTVKYQVEYSIKEQGQLKAVNKGSPLPVDATYMPEPYNLKWDAATMTATADISKPANVLEFELYNTDYNTSYQKNTTGIFTDVPGGRYELRAVAYNDANDSLRSTTTALRVTIDRDPPALTLIPITMAGSLPGAIVTATDLGSGINRIEVYINGIQQPNVKSGDTVYAITEGDNAIKVIAYDNMGNEKAESVTIKFDKKLLNPVIEIQNDTPNEDGKLREWWNSKVTVNVSASNAATKLQYLTLSDGGKMLKMETKNPPEETVTLSFDLETDGEYNLVAQALSPGGIQSGSDEKRTVKIDTKAPEKPNISMDDDGRLTITAEDAGSGIDYIKYQIAGKPEEKYEESVLVTGDGEVSVIAAAYDKAGNVSEASTVKLQVFTEKPTAPIINGVGDSWITSEEPVLVTITPGTNKSSSLDNKLTTKYIVGSESRERGWQTYKEGEEIQVEDEGITKISAYTHDSHGNESDTTVGYVKLDYSSPSMRAIATSPFDSASTRTSFKLYFKDEGSGIDKIFVGISGKEKRLDLTAKHRAQGYVTMTLDLPAVNSDRAEASTDDGGLDETTFVPGAHTVFFRALDKAGNESKIELISDNPVNSSSGGSSGSNTANKTNPHTGGNKQLTEVTHRWRKVLKL